VQAKVDAVDAPYMQILRSGDVLELGMADHRQEDEGQNPVYTVTMKSIDGIRDRNSGRVIVNGVIKTDQLSIVVHNSGHVQTGKLKVGDTVHISMNNSGNLAIPLLSAKDARIYLGNSGTINIKKLRAHALTTTIRNSGRVTIDGGRVDQQTVYVHNSGHYDATDMYSSAATISLHNAGHVQARVNGDVQITKRNSGSIKLYGTPVITNLDVPGNHGIDIVQ
jgi:hypothetical protein